MTGGAASGTRGTDCRLIEMKASLSFRVSRGVKAPGSRASGVAICTTRVGDVQTLQYVATVTDLWNISASEHLHSKSQPTIAVQFCPNWSKALRRLEIRRTRKKCGDSAVSWPPRRSVSRENGQESVAPNGGKPAIT